MRTIDGFASPGFEQVADAFAAIDLKRGGAAFSAYVEGQHVADLWAGQAAPGMPWRRDTLTTAMSATKGVAAAVMLVLHDRGLLDVDAPVSRYWPEFAQAGKESTLVRHVLSHTSGVLGFEDPGAVLDWTGGGWDDYDEIARRIARTPPAWEPGTCIGYHAISVGWLSQELVRRITGTTLGTFLRREVAEPLGVSLFIGTPPAEQERLASVMIGDPTSADSPELAAVQARLRKIMSDPTLPVTQSAIFMHGQTLYENMDFFNLPDVRAAEIPAANGSMDARGLAKLYAVLAEGGELDGIRLASQDSIRLFGTKVFSGASAIAEWSGLAGVLDTVPMRYALGFEGDFGETPKPWRFGPTPKTFGHLGAGGQIGFADPVRRVSVGFLRNDGDDWQASTALVDALYACL